MRIRLLRNVVDEGRAYDAGDVVEVAQETAVRLMTRGAAEKAGGGRNTAGSSGVERAVVVASRQATTGPQGRPQTADDRPQRSVD